MQALEQMFVKLIRAEDGATATEYAVMLVMIILVALATIVVLGQQVEKSFDKFSAELQKHAT